VAGGVGNPQETHAVMALFATLIADALKPTAYISLCDPGQLRFLNDRGSNFLAAHFVASTGQAQAKESSDAYITQPKTLRPGGLVDGEIQQRCCDVSVPL
jgi:hypothetical protein